jgi:methionyl-tRNA formyltransferase
VTVLSTSGVFIGGGSMLIRCADLFAERGHRLVAIASSDPHVQRWAKERGVRCLPPDDGLAHALAHEPFDLLFSIAHLAVLSPGLLALPRRAAINFHDGPLPEYAGLNVTSWALLNREREHAVSWHLMTARVDAGDVLAEVRFAIEPGDTALALNARCYDAGFASFEELLGALERGPVAARRQDVARRRWFGRYARPAAAGYIDWAQPAEEISALVRALDLGPYPNPLATAKGSAGGMPFVVRQLEVLDSRSPCEPGTVVALAGDGAVVSTGTTDVRLGALATVLGAPLAAHELERAGIRPGASLDRLTPDEARAVADLDA